MGWQPGPGEKGESPDLGTGLPAPLGPVRDPQLSGFAADGAGDAARPSAALAVALETASGAEWRCPGATRDEMLGLLRQWQALEAWAAAGKLGLLRALILSDLPGKTYGQVEKLAGRAALTVDPDSATRRREDAEQHKCRVQLFREESGAAGLSGRDLPTDQTLAAHAKVCARAQQYKDSGVFGRETRMDQFRVAAYLDLLNGIPADTRIASGQLASVTRTGPIDDDPADDGPGGSSPGDGGLGGNGPGGDAGDGPSGDGAASPPPRPADLVIPLATLLGRAERPGESHGLGSLDPGLCRQLAAAAAASPRTRLCVTVTGPDGIAVAHGCARAKRGRARRGRTPRTAPAAPASLPARVNLTITAARLAELAGPPATAGQLTSTGPPDGPPWIFARDGDPGPPGGHGTWTLTLPDGRNLTVELEPVPTLECDHRHESHAYQPNDKLRHLVQVRDYECTFPPCSRNARDSDFEHAVPYDRGGRTCGCNAGARSRQCHQVKQSPGWTVTQPKPGWHRWQTPAGRIYVQGPKRYPA